MIGGANAHRDGSKSFEIISFEDLKSCQKVPHFIHDINAPILFTTPNNFLMVCSGKRHVKSKSCFNIQIDQWTHFNELNQVRIDAAVAQNKKATFLFGGCDSPTTFEYMNHNDSKWKSGQSTIPNGFTRGCSVSVSEAEIWLIGGSMHSKRILIFNTKTQTFKIHSLRLKMGRIAHRCAMLSKKAIIITGGKSDQSFWLNSTEIIDLNLMKIVYGSPLNVQRAYHGIGFVNLKNENTLAVFGGYNSVNGKLNTIETYDKGLHKWNIADAYLSEAKINFGFSTISSNSFCIEKVIEKEN